MTSGRNWFRRLLAIIILIALFAGSAMSQEVAVGQVTATVLAGLTVTAVSPLAFGSVFQGVPTTVADNDAAAGIFEISGAPLAGISIYMELPAYLSLSDGSDRMAVSFGATDCSIDSTGAGDPTSMAPGNGWQDVNPHALPSGTAIGGGGTTNVYVGGRIAPAINQSAGSYEADIVITVAYDGT
jgi:hypothetical protein